jgi:hypothetical protein
LYADSGAAAANVASIGGAATNGHRSASKQTASTPGQPALLPVTPILPGADPVGDLRLQGRFDFRSVDVNARQNANADESNRGVMLIDHYPQNDLVAIPALAIGALLALPAFLFAGAQGNGGAAAHEHGAVGPLMMLSFD